MAVLSRSMPMVEYTPARPAVRRTAAEAIAFFRPNSDLSVDPTLPRGDERPILVLPVMGRGDDHTGPTRAAQNQLGHRAFGWGLGTNLGPTPRLLAGIERQLMMLHAEHGPLSVVGFSLGGVFARLLGHLHPDKVRQVVTVCTPFRETVDSAFLPLSGSSGKSLAAFLRSAR
jgi:hypothetical protein